MSESQSKRSKPDKSDWIGGSSTENHGCPKESCPESERRSLMWAGLAARRAARSALAESVRALAEIPAALARGDAGGDRPAIGGATPTGFKRINKAFESPSHQ